MLRTPILDVFFNQKQTKYSKLPMPGNCQRCKHIAKYQNCSGYSDGL